MGMSQALDSYFEQAMTGVHTSLPGEVVDYNETSHRAKVKPSVSMLMGNGIQIELPELLEVPVLFPSAKSFDLEFPLEKGDKVMLVFQEQDISSWKKGDKDPASETASRFSLDSAIAVPGLFPEPQKGKARICVDKNGVITWSAKKIVFDGQLVVHSDLIVRGDVFVGAGVGPGVSMKQHVHPTAVGPSSDPTPATPIPPEEA